MQFYKKIIGSIVFLTFLNQLGFAQVGFNNPNPHPSSLIDLTAYDKGLLVPRMTSLQRIAITDPAHSLMVFDTDLNAYCQYDTVSNPKRWVMINPWKATADNAANVVLGTTGNVGIGVESPVQKLEVDGNIQATNLFTNGDVYAIDGLAGGSLTVLGHTSGGTAEYFGDITCGGNVQTVNVIASGDLYAQGEVLTPSLIVTGNTTGADAQYTGQVNADRVEVANDILTSNLYAVNEISAGSINVGGAVSATSFSGDGIVPAGAIMMWYGTTPPFGWLVCDGTNGTPDLRGRFIVGAGQNSSPDAREASNPNYTVGTVGGRNQYILSATESGLPTHTHTENPHNHQQQVSNTDGYGTQIETNKQQDGTTRGMYASFSTTWGGPFYTANQTATINNAPAQAAATSHENRPPYYVLMYIMKQ